MKTQLLLVLIALLICKASFGDIIIPNTHYVAKCVKITNIEDYPDVTFIGYSFTIDKGLMVTLISSAECLNKGYKYNEFAVYALNKSYLKEKDISKITYDKDPNAFQSNIPIEPYTGHVWDSIPISAIEEYYKIVGFSNTNVILYKWKQVTKYNNGNPDLVENFNYSGDVSSLSQKITVGINVPEKQPNIEVYPNPPLKNIHLSINDSYKGKVAVELITSTGKVIKSFNLNKAEFVLNYDIPVTNVAKGAYIMKVQMGKAVESKKILIK